MSTFSAPAPLGPSGIDPAMSKRAVGYCTNNQCENFLKGTFLLNHGDTFYCPHCRMLGFVERERWLDSDDQVYKTVRVHFNFNPGNKRYMEIAIVDVNELKYGGMYELYSPLIRTEQRALKIAETTLCLLNSGMKNSDGQLSNELIMDVDNGDWDAQILKLERLLEERERRVGEAIRTQ